MAKFASPLRTVSGLYFSSAGNGQLNSAELKPGFTSKTEGLTVLFNVPSSPFIYHTVQYIIYHIHPQHNSYYYVQ